MKLLRFLGRILGHFFKGEFALGFHSFTFKLPDWLICFNRGWIMKTESFSFPEKLNPAVKALPVSAPASESDLDNIVRISGVNSQIVSYLLQSGVVCYLASVGNAPPSSIAWSVSHRCYVRGMGFEYDFGTDGIYIFWVATLPQDRGKGLYMRLASEAEKHDRKRGGRSFYVMVELTNAYSKRMFQKIGYKPILKLTYLKFLSVKVSHTKDLLTGKTSFKVFVRDPEGEITII